MEFYEVLAEVIQLLQREGRASYRALKRQFNLDDAYIEDLKEELLFSHPVVDEDGRGLVWTGDQASEPASQPDQTPQPESQPVIEQAQPVQTTQSIEPHTPEAERRQITVMFVDLVDSTRLSSELDPEDLREIVREYQRSCTEIITRFDGNVAQLLGDGLLVYFGYPQAHEDDAQRAVRSGLGIIEGIGALNTRLEQSKGIRLAIRLGVHTGLVVVGEMGGEGRQEQLALGETPNIASRIQGIAEPNAVVISEATYRLVQGFFECEALGEQDLRGVSQPIAVYRVHGDRGIQSRLDVASTRGLTPLVGRESESTLLFERWAQAKDGNGHVVLLSGEAGIGKSRLVQVIKDHVADEPHTRMECRSSPYFTNSALYPITDFLQRTLRFQADDTPEQRLEKLEENLSQYRLPLEEAVPLFASLLSLSVPEDRYPPLNLSPQRQRQKTLEAIVAIMLELAEREPVLFILEDLHWTDPTTLELLNLLVDQTPTASVYALLTCRPEFQPSWSHRSYLTEVTINRLSRSQITQMAEQVAGGKRLPTEIIQQLVDKTDGVPLYVEEMAKTVLESGVLKDTNGQYELAGSIASLSIPATLQDSLMARLDRLVTAKALAQYASVIGRQFSYELLQAVSELDEATLQRELGRLVEAELVYQRGLPPQATYTFKHALIQDTAYESLLRSTRQGYHRRIAEALVERVS
jgi:class 3 adenylate cyclase